MKLISTSGRGNFKIQKDDSDVLELTYKKWFSSQASKEFNGVKIENKPKNAVSSKYFIYKDQANKGEITFNWKGNITILLKDKQDNENRWFLKSKGFWKQHFELTDQSDNLILILKPTMNWRKMNYNYDIETVL